MERPDLLTNLTDSVLFLAPILYAETHYRFRYFFSFLLKDEPEILADAPHRLDPGNDIPILVLAKDAHLYPSQLLEIRVTVKKEGHEIIRKEILKRPLRLKTKWWWSVIHITRPSFTGWIEISVEFKIDRMGTIVEFKNDNYRGSRHRPLRMYLAEDPLPRLRGLVFGDFHTHSNYTEDQVEFGAPLEPSILLNKAMGNSFFCVTDHSYDLDDRTDNYLLNDPSLPKWNQLVSEVSSLNRKVRDHAIVLGQEVSTRNFNGENIHLLVCGSHRYFPGSGDSAERWFQTTSELSVNEVISGLTRGICVAAHPKEEVPLLQKYLLGRGTWTMTDLQTPHLSGVQFLNGDTRNGFSHGIEVWTKLLLSGCRLIAYAGNDAHGNFNRFRQLGIPFFAMREHGRQLFGRMKTGVFLKGRFSDRFLLDALLRGEVILSDGPAAHLSLMNENRVTFGLGQEALGRTFVINCFGRSTDEFGGINRVRVLAGLLGQEREHIIHDISLPSPLEFRRSFAFVASQRGYIRLEIYTSSDNPFNGQPHFCMTNPVWFHPSS